MSYAQTEVKNSRNRSRNIIWFNPLFSQNVKTNIGKLFLKLVKKHFPKHHRLHKLFNPNTVKLSYSCMSNMSSFIKNITLIFYRRQQKLRSAHAIVEIKTIVHLMAVA